MQRIEFSAVAENLGESPDEFERNLREILNGDKKNVLYFFDNEKLYSKNDSINSQVLGEIKMTEITSLDLLTNLISSLSLSFLKKENENIKLKIENENLKIQLDFTSTENELNSD